MMIEQRIYIKFCVKLRKTATETLKMVRDVYGDSSMSRTTVFERHKQFVKGREDVEDDLKSGRPCTSKRFGSWLAVTVALTICVIANKVGMDKEMVHTILVDTLGMQKVLLTEEQKLNDRMHAKTSFNRWKQTKNSWKASSQETSHGSFNMIRKQNDKVVNGKLCPRPDQEKPACTVHK